MAVPLLVSTIFLVILAVMLNLSAEEGKREAHDRDIVLTVQRIDALGRQLTFSTMHYMVTHSNITSSSQKLLEAQYAQQSAFLERLVADDPELSALHRQIKMTEDHTIVHRRQIEQLIPEDTETQSPLAMVPYFAKLRADFKKLMLEKEQFADAVMHKQRKSTVSSASWKAIIASVLLIGLLSNVGLSLFLSNLFSRSMSKRLSTLVDNSVKLSCGQPLNPPIKGADEIAKLDSVFHDMAAKLDASARKEKAVVDEAVDVICSLDYNGRFVAINPACQSTWGYSPDELLGKHMSSIAAGDDIADTHSWLQEMVGSNSEAAFENRIVRKDQTIVHMLWSVFRSQAQKLFFCVAHDVTQRKMAETLLREGEARMRQILESVPLGLLILSPDGAIEMINQSIEQMYGYSDSNLVGQPVSILFKSNQSIAAQQLLEELQSSSWGLPSQLIAVTQSGAIFPADLVLTEFFIFGERKWLVVVADVSQRKETERLKQEFIAMVSHDLRTPLTTVMMTMQSLSSGAFGDLNEKGSTRITAAQHEVSRLVHLINGLLELDKLEAGHLEVEYNLVDINEVLERSIGSVGYLAEKNGIQITKSVSASDVLADSSSLIQVLVNLLANAIKFSARGSTIEVSAAETAGAVEIRVKDQGRGIPASSIDTVFDRFKQVERADRTDKGGSGLGLAICKSIVEAHKGTIGVESEVGAGSTFWFRIPLMD